MLSLSEPQAGAVSTPVLRCDLQLRCPRLGVLCGDERRQTAAVALESMISDATLVVLQACDATKRIGHELKLAASVDHVQVRRQ